METGTGDPRRVWKRVAPTLEPWPGADAVGKALRDGAKADGVILASEAVSKEGGSGTGAQSLSAAKAARDMRMTATAGSPGAVRTPQALSAMRNAPQELEPVRTPQELEPVRNAPQELEPVRTSQELSDVRTPQGLSAMRTPEETFGADLPGAEPDPCCMGTEAEADAAVLAGFAEDEYAERRQLQALARQAPVWARQTLLTLSAHAAARAKRSTAAYYLIMGEQLLPPIYAERIYVGKWLPALRERYHSAACTAMNYERAADGTPDPCLNALFRELSADAFTCAAAVMRLLERALT